MLMKILCIACKTNVSYNPMCEECHDLYWKIAYLLSAEQNNELQLAMHYNKPIPKWFDNWWNKMQNLTAFL